MMRKSLSQMSLGVVFGLTACASYNPYVTPDATLYPTVKADTLTANEIIYAQAQVELWRDKANSVSNSQLYINSIILPTAITAANFAVTGDRGESAITTLSTIALGGLTLRELSRANPRQAIYMSGIKALECLAWNAAPLAIDTNTIARLDANIVAVDGQTVPLAAQLADLEAAIAAIKTESAQWTAAGKSELVAMETQIGVVKSELQDAKLALDGGNGLSGTLTRAPGQLRARIGSIQYEVDNQLRQQEASPETILRIATGFGTSLQSYVTSITPAPADTSGGQLTTTSSKRKQAARATASETAALGLLNAKLSVMNQSLAPLQASKATLKSIVAANAQALNAIDTFTDCEVEGVVKPIKIIPPDLIREVTAETHGVTVLGGSGFFDVSKVGRKADGFEINYKPSILPNQTDVNFVVSAGFSGDQIVSIRDTSNQEVQPVYITFRAKPKEEGAGLVDPTTKTNQQGGTTRPTGVISRPVPPDGRLLNTSARVRSPLSCSATPSKKEALILQSVFIGSGVEPFSIAFIDGKWGDKSKAAGISYLGLYDIQVVDPDLVACRIADMVDRDPDFRNDFFLDAERIKADRMDCEAAPSIENCWDSIQR